MVVYERFSLGFPGSGYEMMPDILEGLWTTDDWLIFLHETVNIEEERVAQDSRAHAGSSGLGVLIGAICGVILRNQFSLRFWIVAVWGFFGSLLGYGFAASSSHCSDKIWKLRLADYCAEVARGTPGLTFEIHEIYQGNGVPADLKGSGLDQDLLYALTLIVRREHPRELDTDSDDDNNENVRNDDVVTGVRRIMSYIPEGEEDACSMLSKDEEGSIETA
jgi:hypothetical protein